MKKNKKALIMIPIVLAMAFLLLILLLFVTSKHVKSMRITESMKESTISEVENARGDLFIKIKEGKKITNPKLAVLGKETYDDGTINEYNVLDTVLTPWDEVQNSEKVQYIDRIITARKKNLTVTNNRESPDKANNVFEVDLVNFLKQDWTKKGNISDMILSYGTNPDNTPPVYALLWRVKKNSSINVDELYEEKLSKKKLKNTSGFDGYTTSTQNIDSFSFEYIKIEKPSVCKKITDPDVPSVKWCNSSRLNTSFNLNKYFYKLFIVFGTKNNDNYGVPFKLESADGGPFGLGNIDYGDVTILTPNNSKRRFIIESSKDNSSLPYLVYSLWVKGKVDLKK